jgi:hypothetical protein
MANMQIIASLQELQQDSGKRIPDSVVTGMTLSFSRARYQLIRSRANPSGAGFIDEPTDGIASLPRNTQAIRKLRTLPAGIEDNFTYMLNTALLGGKSYPILTAVLGTLAGAVSVGAGFLFTVASTALSVAQTSQRVLARAGDELWQVEEIGKIGSTAVHIGSYFLVDPFRGRGQSRIKGWLIHEQRTKLDI